MSLLTDEIKSLIGKEATYEAPEELGRAAIRYFAMATGDPNPLYRDEEFARQTRFGGIIAPPTLVCETNQYMTGQPREDGNLGHEWEVPLSNARVLRGGNEYEFLEPVRPTDCLRVTWRISDIFEKESRSGSLLFVVSEAYYHNQDGKLLAINRETVIYQEIPHGDS